MEDWGIPWRHSIGGQTFCKRFVDQIQAVCDGKRTRLFVDLTPPEGRMDKDPLGLEEALAADADRVARGEKWIATGRLLSL